MARSIFACFLVFVALLVGVTSSNAQSTGTGITIDGLSVVQLNVSGTMACTPLGIPLPGGLDPPIVGINVTLSCDDGVTIVGQAMTDSLGSFEIIANATNINPMNLGSCLVNVPLLNLSCPYLLLGSLKIPLTVTAVVDGYGVVIMHLKAGSLPHILL